MVRSRSRSPLIRPALVVGLLLLLAGVALVSTARAQETQEPTALPTGEQTPGTPEEPTTAATEEATPGATEEGTPGATEEATPGTTPDEPPATDTVVRIEIESPEPEPVPEGTEILVRVLVENVEHLAGFSLDIAYDDSKLRPLALESDSGTPLPTPEVSLVEGGGALIQVRDLGQFIAESERGQGLLCPDPVANDNEVVLTCSTLGPALCLGGGEGASGSGVLATIPMVARGGGVTNIVPVDGQLALDDLEPCDPTDGQTLGIPHRLQGASIELSGDDDFPWVIVLVIIAIVVGVLGVGGWFGYRLYQQRQSAST